MNNKHEPSVTHAYCRLFGLTAAAFWTVSFVCAMQRESIMLGQMSQFIGFMSIFVIGRQLKMFRTTIEPITFRRAWWMATLSFLYASLVTAVVQYAYMRFFDKGQLAMTFDELLKIEEYKQILTSMGDGASIDALRSTLTSPTLVTKQLFWMNILLSLLLGLPTALIGYIGKIKENA